MLAYDRTLVREMKASKEKGVDIKFACKVLFVVVILGFFTAL